MPPHVGKTTTSQVKLSSYILCNLYIYILLIKNVNFLQAIVTDLQPVNHTPSLVPTADSHAVWILKPVSVPLSPDLCPYLKVDLS